MSGTPLLRSRSPSRRRRRRPRRPECGRQRGCWLTQGQFSRNREFASFAFVRSLLRNWREIHPRLCSPSPPQTDSGVSDACAREQRERAGSGQGGAPDLRAHSPRRLHRVPCAARPARDCREHAAAFAPLPLSGAAGASTGRSACPAASPALRWPPRRPRARPWLSSQPRALLHVRTRR